MISSLYIMKTFVRTLVDIPAEELQRLTALSKERKVSRAHLVRCAVSQYLAEEEGKETRKDTLDELFGIWKDRNIDGLAYQEMMRKEWDREF